MNEKPHVIVLAAGQSSRFGGGDHKLKQDWFGSTLLEATLRHAVTSHLPVVVVTTNALADLARQHVAARDVVVVPEMGSACNHLLGVGYSIAAGVAASSQASGWLILPADMPLIQPTTLQLIAVQLKQHAVVFAQLHGRRGHPVGFAAELFSELVALTGDEGAKRLVARYPSHAVQVLDEGVILDVDTPQDLARAKAACEIRLALLAPSHSSASLPP